jgi:hypothetical protein
METRPKQAETGLQQAGTKLNQTETKREEEGRTVERKREEEAGKRQSAGRKPAQSKAFRAGRHRGHDRHRYNLACRPGGSDMCEALVSNGNDC